MSPTLEIALLFLIIAVIIVLGFLIKLIIDSIKLVQNIDETTTIVKNEIEPTLKELNKTLENINSLTNDTDNKINQIRKILTGTLGIGSFALGGVRNITGGFFKGLIEGIKFFSKKK